MKPFREHTPSRTCTKQYSSYRSYKKYLRDDFGKRCGYCNDLDELCGGERGFHIDHFRPKKYFEHLHNDYNNLVYACLYCNISKSDDWPDNDKEDAGLKDVGYIDPCSTAFTYHFERYPNGRIRPKTELGRYMFRRLKLGLRRHQLAWSFEQVERLLRQIVEEISLVEEDPQKNELSIHATRLLKEYLQYKDLFNSTL